MHWHRSDWVNSMNLDEQQLHDLIQQHATHHVAPDTLRAAVRTQIALADAGRLDAPLDSAARQRPAWPWRTAALSFSLGVACAAVLWPIAAQWTLRDGFDAELVADHVRALQAGPLIAVASSDHHTVKPWFQGRLDYAPPVPDLAADGFALAGGRIEQVRAQPVAALAYLHQRHVIDVFVWPSTAATPAVMSTRRGFNVLHWADDSMQVWAVSDMERAELSHFAQAWQAHAQPTGRTP